MSTLIGLGMISVLFAAGDAEGTVLKMSEGQVKPADIVPAYLKDQARSLFAKRRARFEELKTSEQCTEYQQRMREFFLRQIGPLPARQPLNAQVVGTLDGDGFRAEKVIYESQPRHHVTAVLYLPEGTPPFPGVLIACGHSKNGKAADYNQRMGILLAKNGLAALCYDPIGQGERSQILLPDHKPKHGSTTEHSLVGVGAIPLGWNTATHRIYDGMRSIDYLASRPEIDAARIGCTGCSGGGTMTSYLMVLDDRVACAAPACFVTTQELVVEKLGPQDAEQNICGQIAFGMEQTDYVLMRAPKPTLICSTTHDFFDIQGSWDTLRQAKRFYARLGFPERVDLVEDDSDHGVTKLNRGTLTHWMQRWLLGKDAHVVEPDFPLFTDAQLTCTPDGQVLLLPNEKSIFDFQAERADELQQQRRAYWAAAKPEDARRAIRERAAIRALADLPVPTVKSAGSTRQGELQIERLVFEVEPRLLVPALLFTPAAPNGDLCLYLHGNGKDQDAGANGPIAQLAAQGKTVLAVDLPGMGETTAGTDALLGDWKQAFLAYLLAKPYVAIRAESILQCARHYATMTADKAPRRVQVVAIGASGVPALHAAALEPQLFASVVIRQSIPSWDLVVRTPEAKNQLVNVVHGALALYDLPNLVQLAEPGQVALEEPLDATGQPLK